MATVGPFETDLNSYYASPKDGEGVRVSDDK